jgi:hypothetical protein
LLAWVEGLGDFLSNRAFAHPPNKVFYHAVIDIGFQQGQAHLAHCRVNIRLGKLSAPAQAVEHTF